jgi:hypothetical protein
MKGEIKYGAGGDDDDGMRAVIGLRPASWTTFAWMNGWMDW